MSLTKSPALLASKPAGARNFSIDGPAHRILFEPHPRRFRAEVDGVTILDTVGGHLLHESQILPVLYVPLEDVDDDRLQPSDHTTHCPFKGDASYWHVRVGDRLVENALWSYEDPKPEASWLAGFGSLYWHLADAWYEEDERLFGHVRDPYHRVDVRRTSRRAVAHADGEVVAESTQATLLFETTLPTRVYFPREDVREVLLEPSGRRTVCPYKGSASYWTVNGVESAAWTYEDPVDGAAGIRGLVSFLGEGVEVELEGAGTLDTSAMR